MIECELLWKIGVSSIDYICTLETEGGWRVGGWIKLDTPQFVLCIAVSSYNGRLIGTDGDLVGQTLDWSKIAVQL